MLISYNWLNTYLDVNLSVDEIAEILTDTGLEVEGVEKNLKKDKLADSVLVGLVKSVEKHPEADKLTICQVDIGQESDLQIICGAPNVATGQKVPVATIGTVLNPIEGDPFKIKKSKLRGSLSEGMICAEDELGIGKSHDGIMILDSEIKTGIPFKDTIKDEGDAIIEIAITPNRGDAISMLGVARDVAAFSKTKAQYPSIDAFKVENSREDIKVSIEEESLCPRYSAVCLSGIEVKDSPEWLQNRLKSIGLNPINNIVDACNFLMFENGQPLHAFDLAKISDKHIIVKKLAKGIKFKTLDESEVELSGSELMICDATKGIAIGGVMGGFESMVTAETDSILIESAHFNPTSIRKTARQHTFFTDAAYRFERGSDPNFTVVAVKRAALLIKEIAGGEISSEIIDAYPNPIKNKVIDLSFDYVNGILGNKLSNSVIVDIIKSLEYSVLKENDKMIQVEVPTYRPDVLRPIDLVEEVLRIYSYNKIEFSDLVTTPLPESKVDERSKFLNGLANYLTSSGFNELLTPSFFSSANIDQENTEKKAIKTLNAVNANLDTLRNNFLLSGLDALSYNYKRNQYNLKFFEMGKIYFQKAEGKYIEEEKLAIWLSGSIHDESWFEKTKKIDIYFLKSIVQNLISLSGVKANILEESIKENDYSFAILLTANGKELAKLGLIKAEIGSRYDIKDDVYYAELNLDYLYKLYRKKSIQYQQPARFPFMLRDLSIVLTKEIKYSDIKSSIEALHIKMMKELILLDVYEGKNLDSDKKSYTIRMKFQDDENTLKDKQVDSYISTIINVLENQHKAIIRK